MLWQRIQNNNNGYTAQKCHLLADAQPLPEMRAGSYYAEFDAAPQELSHLRFRLLP